jgi:hypothetical protein
MTPSVTITIDVQEGTAGAEVIDPTPAQYGLLNHGQIVSAWAYWKQTTKTHGTADCYETAPLLFKTQARKTSRLFCFND